MRHKLSQGGRRALTPARHRDSRRREILGLVKPAPGCCSDQSQGRVPGFCQVPVPVSDQRNNLALLVRVVARSQAQAGGGRFGNKTHTYTPLDRDQEQMYTRP